MTQRKEGKKEDEQQVSSSTDRVASPTYQQEKVTSTSISSAQNQTTTPFVNHNVESKPLIQNIDIENLKNLQNLQKISNIKNLTDLQELQNLKTPAILIFYPPSSQQNQQPQQAQANTQSGNKSSESSCSSPTSPQPPSANPYDILKNASSIPVISVSSTVKDKTDQNRERIFICPYANCNKTYFKNSHLKTHIRSHTGKE